MTTKKFVHGFAATVAIMMVMLFWGSTVISEVFFDQQAVKMVKQAIVYYGLVIMVLAMMVTGASGFMLSKGSAHPVIATKKKRMPFIALNGLFIMLPLAIYLNHKAANNMFDGWFISMQILELVVGAIQFILLTKNFTEGIKLTRLFNNG